MTLVAHVGGVPVEELLPVALASLPAITVALRGRFAGRRGAGRPAATPTSPTSPNPGASR